MLGVFSCTKIELDAQKVMALVAGSNVYVGVHTKVKRWKKLNARNRCPTFEKRRRRREKVFLQSHDYLMPEVLQIRSKGVACLPRCHHTFPEV